MSEKKTLHTQIFVLKVKCVKADRRTGLTQIVEVFQGKFIKKNASKICESITK